jgi:hypothetical protein
MLNAKLFVGVIAAALAATGMRAVADVDLPPGPNRDLVVHTCSACHELGNLTDTGGLSPEDWDGTLDDMKSYGAMFTDGERRQILDYLVKALPRKK